MPTRQECIDAAGRTLALIREQIAEAEARRAADNQASSPAQGSGEDTNSAAVGVDAPRPPAVAEHHRKSA